MKTCPNCSAQLEDNAVFCAACGTPIAPAAPEPESWDPNPGYAYPPAAPVVPNYDHTAEYDPADMSANKILALLAYLTGVIGIIVALLAAKESPFVMFHVRQAVKLSVTMTLTWIITVLLSWTIIVGIAGAIFLLVLEVVQIICFFNACNGKAIEAPIVRSIKFLN